MKISIIDTNTPYISDFADALSTKIKVIKYNLKPLLTGYKNNKAEASAKIIYYLPKYYSFHLSKLIFIRQVFSSLKNDRSDYIILTSPFYKELLKFPNSKKIYYSYDNYRLYKGWNASNVIEYEEEIIENVENIVTSSYELKKFFQYEYNVPKEKIIHIPNATRNDFIIPDQPLCLSDNPLKHFPRPLAGCVGMIDNNRIDIDLLVRLVEGFPKVSFIFIGSVNCSMKKDKNFNILRNKKNVSFMGFIERENLYKYIWQFDVLLAPLRVNEFNYFASPVRIFDYMAAGKPIISTSIPEIEYLFKKLIHIAKDREEFIQIFKELYDKNFDDGMYNLRRQISFKHTWEERVNKFLFHIENKTE